MISSCDIESESWVPEEGPRGKDAPEKRRERAKEVAGVGSGGRQTIKRQPTTFPFLKWDVMK